MSLPQTFNDVIAILNTSVNRTDLAPNYADWINKAVRDTASAHSFEQMKATGSVTLTSGQTSVALLATLTRFKEPQSLRYWVQAAIGGATLVRVPVYSREEMETLPSFRPSPYLIYTQDNQDFQLGLVPPSTASANYVMTIYYFAYPAAVTDLTTGTPLLTFYPNMILSKTMSLIFQSLNDPIWETHEQEWAQELFRWTGVDRRLTRRRPVPTTEEKSS